MKKWYRKLDRAWTSLEQGASEKWRRTLEDRMSPRLRQIPGGCKLMERLAIAIAYSQGARSDQVARMVESGHLGSVLHDFNVDSIANEKPAQLLRRYWKKPLTCIRYPGKLASMIKCARVLRDIEIDHGSFAHYLRPYCIPRRVKTLAEISNFWANFDLLQKDLKRRNIPFFSNTTSLLQLLLDLDYDSVKPDLIVMRVAKDWGIVARETGNPAFREAVRAFQQYGVDRGRRPLAVDWVVLTHGKQKGALASWEGKL